MGEVLEIKRSDLLSLMFEDRFPYPQLRLMFYHEGLKIGVEGDGSIRFMPKGKDWMTLEEIESELLKKFR